ncbi:MAG: nuclear transport factor 2 family protein [Steroidobacteraceae bacterium]|jgi:hypothetical protein|nr:nuclear transport factor 2 family protein [Steroidobacteraceae bacterium]
MDEPRASLDALLADYYARFGAFDVAGMKAHWDTDDPEPVYLAEEIGGFLHDWPSIEKYWDDTRRGLSRLAARHWDLRARRLGDDLAIGTWRMHWDCHVVGQPKPVGGEVRVTATFRHLESGWKLIHYVEAPLAPIVYVRALYEQQVTAGFATSS